MSLPETLDRTYQRGTADLRITSIGHATFLLEVQGRLILTDPWFYETPFTGRHPEPVGFSLERLPSPDLVLLTHDHIDHFDRRAVAQIEPKTIPVICPPGMASKVRRLGFSRVIELDPWEAHVSGPVRIIAVPAAHLGLSHGYVIATAETRLYFAGETTLFPELRAIAARFPRPDVAFLPADGLQTRWGRKLAMDAEEAVQAVEMLRPSVVIPIPDHDFSGSLSALVLETTDSADRLGTLLEARSADTMVVPLRAGASWVLPHSEPLPGRADGPPSRGPHRWGADP